MLRVEEGRKRRSKKRKEGKVWELEREICTYGSLLGHVTWKCTVCSRIPAPLSLEAPFNWNKWDPTLIHAAAHTLKHTRPAHRAYKYPCESKVSLIAQWNPWAETSSQTVCQATVWDQQRWRWTQYWAAFRTSGCILWLQQEYFGSPHQSINMKLVDGMLLADWVWFVSQTWIWPPAVLFLFTYLFDSFKRWKENIKRPWALSKNHVFLDLQFQIFRHEKIQMS